MKPLSMESVAGMCGGRLVHGDPGRLVRAVTTDSRTPTPDSLFVALSGERFDAHDFLADAVRGGAVGLLVSRAPVGENFPGVTVVQVEDTLVGLQSLARGYREIVGGTGVGVTGSSGKTSTKDMIAAVLAVRFRVRATRGNLNNHIGLPLTLLAMEPGDAFGVWEMGMNHPGEIATLASIARPEIGVVTNIGTAHIEFMGSREAIAREKGALVEALPGHGCAVLNADDPFTPEIAARTRAKVLTAGIEHGDVRAGALRPEAGATRFELRCQGDAVDVRLPVAGEHMVRNAVLAAAVGLQAGLSGEEIAGGLAGVQLSGGRLELRTVGRFRVLDDSYNANPESMRAALATLAVTPCRGRRIAALGGMAELGEVSEHEHHGVGEAVAGAGVDLLCVVGPEGRWLADGAGAGIEVRQFEEPDACGAWLRREAGEDDLVLVKGSRAARMERVVAALGES